MQNKKKVIRDVVHGYILIDALTEKLINTYNFQRLKDIRQLTAQHVYPCATHNRFEHSLGVMHLAEQAFEALRPFLKEKGKTTEELESLGLHFKITALLHDVGHAPFSHLGENFFPPKEEIYSAIQKQLREIDYKKSSVDIFSSNTAKHELMSCYVILSKFYPILNRQFADRNIKLDIELICRAIVGKTYDDIDKRWAENIIIQLLNSSTIDMDKLDYLMRDAYMTGISVPSIDSVRLLKNIQINEKTNNVTFAPQALPVIQSIVEARDNMYLWVYNHHVAVYTDFLIRYYIKHLIHNDEAEPGSTQSKYRDRLNPRHFFSCDAIAERMASDSDLWSVLKRPLWSPCDEDDISPHGRVLIPQLLERRFLKPLWKTIYDFRHFMIESIKDDTIREEVIKNLGDSEKEEYRAYVAEEIRTACNLQLGEILIVPCSNKFYSLAPNTVFTVYINDGEKKINTLLPQKDYKELYGKVSFYVFCRGDRKDDVEKAFIKLINDKPLPPVEKLENYVTRTKWEM
ncbi:MAG: HD domain-containing protein [Bacillota bacterium]|jgi:HD superfamily phosphohydrolase